MASREVELLEWIAELLVEIRDRLPEPAGCEDCAPGPIPHPDELDAAVRAKTEKLRREIVCGVAAASSFPVCDGPCKHAYCAEKKRGYSPGGYPPASACAICSKLNVPWCQCRKPEPHPESPF